MIITASNETISIRFEEQTFAEMLDSLARARAAVIALTPAASPGNPMGTVTAAPEEPPTLSPETLAKLAPVEEQTTPAPAQPQPVAAAPEPTPAQPVRRAHVEPQPVTAAPEPEPVSEEEMMTAIMEFDALGVEVYGAEQWATVSATNISRISAGATDNPEELSLEQINRLIAGLKRIKANGAPTPQPAGVPAAPRGRTVAPAGAGARNGRTNGRINGRTNGRNYRAEAAQPSNVIMATG